MSECIVRFGNCGRSFLSLVIYKSVWTKIFVMLVSLLWFSSYFRNASTDAVHIPWLSLWVHWYRCCIVSFASPQRRKMLVVACPLCYRIFIVDKVLLIHFVMECDIWKLILSCACLNYVRSIPLQSSMWVRFQLAHYWSIRSLDISYALDWVRL